jgi:hypothetical protein
MGMAERVRRSHDGRLDPEITRRGVMAKQVRLRSGVGEPKVVEKAQDLVVKARESGPVGR